MLQLNSVLKTQSKICQHFVDACQEISVYKNQAKLDRELMNLSESISHSKRVLGLLMKYNVQIHVEHFKLDMKINDIFDITYSNVVNINLRNILPSVQKVT